MFRALLILAVVVALSVAANADTPIPYTNCGSPGIEIATATASVWPPKSGADDTLTLAGALLNPLYGNATYTLNATLDYILPVNMAGTLQDLITKYKVNITFPIPAGSASKVETVKIPANLSGSNVKAQIAVNDANGSKIMCIGIDLTLGATGPKELDYTEEGFGERQQALVGLFADAFSQNQEDQQ